MLRDLLIACLVDWGERNENAGFSNRFSFQMNSSVGWLRILNNLWWLASLKVESWEREVGDGSVVEHPWTKFTQRKPFIDLDGFQRKFIQLILWFFLSLSLSLNDLCSFSPSRFFHSNYFLHHFLLISFFLYREWIEIFRWKFFFLLFWNVFCSFLLFHFWFLFFYFCFRCVYYA